MDISINPGKSRWPLLLFASLTLIVALFTEFVRPPEENYNAISPLDNPIGQQFLLNLKEINLTNRTGTFKLMRQNSQSDWEMVSPRQLPTSHSHIQKILDSLKDLKIRKAFPFDAINVANFSLKSPLVSLKARDFNDNEIHFRLGILNSIDNSAFVAIDSDIIYQVNRPKHQIESFDLPDFIDSRIFKLKVKDIDAIKISPFRQSSLQISKKNGEWSGKDHLTKELVEKYLLRLTNLRGLIILDQRSEKLEKQITGLMKKPNYTLVLNAGEKKVTIKMAYLPRKLDGVKIEKKKGLLITTSEREHPYIISRGQISLFAVREKSFKKRK